MLRSIYRDTEHSRATGATSHNTLFGSSDDRAAGDSSCSPAPTPKVVDVEAGTKGVAVVLPARLPTTRTRGTCPSFRAAEAVGDPTAAAEAATAAAEAIRHRRR